MEEFDLKEINLSSSSSSSKGGGGGGNDKSSLNSKVNLKEVKCATLDKLVEQATNNTQIDHSTYYFHFISNLISLR